MNRLRQALDECLTAIEKGESLDPILERYRRESDELARLLEAAQTARAAGRADLSEAARDRGRINLLRRAAELRKGRATKRRPLIAPLARVGISLALVLVLVLTSTRLVGASSTALPGDQLYTVKRSWEDLQLFFVFQIADHQLLESRFTQERLDETSRLLVQGRSAPISFSGLVMHQQDGTWLVSGIRVSVTAATQMPSRPIGESDPVVITGVTGSDGSVTAQQVQLLQPGVALPPLEPTGNEAEATDGGSEPQAGGQSPTTGSPAAPGPTPTPSQAAEPVQGQPAYQFTGIVGSMQGSAWIINGQPVHVDQAQITGDVKVGSIVTFDGYYGPNGRFEVTQVTVNWSPQVKSGGNQGDGGGGGSPASGNSGSEGGSDDSGEGH